MGFFQTFFVIQFVKSSRKGICGLKVIIQNLSWKLCFVKPEEREYVSQEILIITKNYCWLFLWITLGMSRFRRGEDWSRWGLEDWGVQSPDVLFSGFLENFFLSKISIFLFTHAHIKKISFHPPCFVLNVIDKIQIQPIPSPSIIILQLHHLLKNSYTYLCVFFFVL